MVWGKTVVSSGGPGHRPPTATFRMMKKGWSYTQVEPRGMAYMPHLRRMKDEGAPPPKAIAIGIGGGVDLRMAVEFGVASIMGVEINHEIVNLTGRDYADFNGGFTRLPHVNLIAGEGRSTLRRLDEKFDVIQISGVDTYTAGATGSFVLSESYLYTQEALRRSGQRLTTRMKIQFVPTQWGRDPRESLRRVTVKDFKPDTALNSLNRFLKNNVPGITPYLETRYSVLEERYPDRYAPSISPDGSKILFRSWRAGNLNLFLY